MHSRRLLLLPLIAILSLTATAPTGAQTEGKRRVIEVSGSAEVSAAPDLAVVAFAVETTAPQAAAAVEQNAARSSKVASALKQRLGAKDRLSTTRYSLEPRYQTPGRGSQAPPTITGYVAHNEVRVETHDLDHLGQLLDAAITAGANRVSELQFTLEDRNPTLRAALAKAGAEARAQAESIAAALGVQLKQVVSATSSPPPIIPRRYDGRAMVAAAEGRAATEVEPGEVSVTATLQVTYEIE
jgi:uncharacterized protein YggE